MASAANLRIADILIMMDDEPRRRSSSDTRQALTVALVKPGRGACRNQAINSSSAMLYTRFVIGEETLSSTSVFNFCHCAIFSRLINSFILGPDIGHYSVAYRHEDITSVGREHQAEIALMLGAERTSGTSRKPEPSPPDAAGSWDT